MLNINVGVLGHVDSGKTSLSKALSTVASTAAFDKNPQSQKRGITLDLGFSSFKISHNIPIQFSSAKRPIDTLQITLVDCPGHASLIRTILCGSRIIDLMLLVIDVNKGFQTQTSECLIIGELTCDGLIIVLNKIDLLDSKTRDEKVAKMMRKILKTVQNTKFKNCSIVPVSTVISDKGFYEGIPNLIQLLLQTIPCPVEKRRVQENLPFLFAVDHCFAKSGQGTVLTGTVLNGCLSVGNTVEIPQNGLKKPVKSMQMFHQPVDTIFPGDRVGICIAKLDSGVMERGFLIKPGSLVLSYACLLNNVHKIPYFKTPIESKGKFHVFIGQETVIARINCLLSVSDEFEYLNDLICENIQDKHCMLLEFESPVLAPINSLVIGSRLDTDPLTSSCRLAFHGRIAQTFTNPNYRKTELLNVSAYRKKSRRGMVERIIDNKTCIVRGLFKKETNWSIFEGLKVRVCLENSSKDSGSLNASGVIDGSFGQSGKCRVRLLEDLPDSVLMNQKQSTTKAVKLEAGVNHESNQLCVILDFKKHVFDPKRKFVQ